MEQRIKDEQLKILYAGLPSALLGTAVLLVLTMTLSELTGAAYVIRACLLIFFVTALRGLLWLAYRRQPQAHPDAWSNLFLAGCIASGTAWGIASLIVFPHGDIAAQTFLTFLIGGVSAAGVTILAVDLRSVLAFVLPCVLPLASRLYAEPGDYGGTMASMVLVYLFVILTAGFRLNRQILENIVLRLEAAQQQRTQQRSEQELEVANRNLREAIEAADRTSEALRRLNERFELATHSGDMGIWDWDVTADTLVWDERTYEIFGAPRDISPDMDYMLSTVHPEDVDRARAELLAGLSGKEQQLRTSFRIICPSGEERTVSASGLTLRNASGRAVRMTGLIWDITETQRIERMKNEFVATVSHELRTPLTSIRGSLGLVAGGVAGNLPERAAALVDMALNNCERLTLLINDILDMERLESDRQRFDVRRMDVAELVSRSLEDNAGFAQSLGVHFTTPEPLCHADVLVDPDRFLQVMANLLSNASKFSPAGAAIEVTAKCVGDTVRVAVRDFGRGITAEFQPRLFQKFSQADSSDSRSRTGTGLGLAISRAIVERLGGRIGVDTGPGGSTFFFELPDARSAGALAPAATRSQAS